MKTRRSSKDSSKKSNSQKSLKSTDEVSSISQTQPIKPRRAAANEMMLGFAEKYSYRGKPTVSQ